MCSSCKGQAENTIQYRFSTVKSGGLKINEFIKRNRTLLYLHENDTDKK